LLDSVPGNNQYGVMGVKFLAEGNSGELDRAQTHA